MKVIETMKRVLGEDHPNTLIGIGNPLTTEYVVDPGVVPCAVGS